MAKRKRSKYPGIFPSGLEHWGYVLDLPPSWDIRTDPETGATTRIKKRNQEKRAGYLTERSAWEARVAREAEVKRGKGVNRSNPTVTECCKTYLADHRVHIKPSTYFRHTTSLRLYITPFIGDIKVKELLPSDVRSWITTLAEKPLSPGTMRQAFAVLAPALDLAIDDKLIADNPARARGVRMPAIPKHTPRVWTPDQIVAFFEVADRDEYAMLWRLAILCQLRPGELAGLTWADIDTDAGVLLIAQTRTLDAEGKKQLGNTPKTDNGKRTIDLPTSCLQGLTKHRRELAERRLRFPGRWIDKNLVFPGRNGDVLHPSTIDRRLRTMTAAAGIKTIISPHELRHTGATWARKLGTDAEVVSRRLGHASVEFTLDVYSHAQPDEQRTTSDRLEAALLALQRRRAKRNA